MAYVSPTITPSGWTYAQFKAGGWMGLIDRIISVNGFSTNVANLIRSYARNYDGRHGAETRWRGLVNNWIKGNPTDATIQTSRFLEHTTARKAVFAAAEEVAVLWDANQGTLGYRLDGAGYPVPIRIV